MLAHAFLLSLVVAGAGADELTQTRIPPVKVRVPGAWKHTAAEGTQRFEAPSGDAFFLFDVGRTQSPMNPGVCLDKITAQLGGEAWTKLSIGASPAARKTDIDHNEDKNVDVETVTYVGCDGRVTWSMVFHLDARKKERFEPLAEKISQSIAYPTRSR